MKPIYKPKGAAAEYGDYAVNIYTRTVGRRGRSAGVDRETSFCRFMGQHHQESRSASLRLGRESLGVGDRVRADQKEGGAKMRDLHILDKYRQADLERRVYGTTGDSGNGIFKVYIEGRSFRVVASDGGGWEHVSVSPLSTKRKTCPTWEEMCAVKDLFFMPEERVVQYHPPQSEYVNNHPFCLHLWRCTTADFPHPPMIFV